MGTGPEYVGLSRPAIRRAIDDSLRRLGTDYLDIYYLHQPDYETPIEETLDAMEELRQEGKIRYVATSNYASWQIAEILWISEKKGYPPPVISQPMYKLLARGIERALLVQQKPGQPSEDLAHVLRRWQEGGIRIAVCSPGGSVVEDLDIKKPSRFRSLWYRLGATVGLLPTARAASAR